MLSVAAAPDGELGEPVGKLCIYLSLCQTTRKVDALRANYLKWSRLFYGERSTAGSRLTAPVPGVVLHGYTAAAGTGRSIILQVAALRITTSRSAELGDPVRKSTVDLGWRITSVNFYILRTTDF